jgi:ABC-type bacteriocin/lantibiotic exporter with double-glycine peptidase domain
MVTRLHSLHLLSLRVKLKIVKTLDSSLILIQLQKVATSRFSQEPRRRRTLGKRPRSQHPLQRLINYGHHYRKQIWLATGCSILNKIFDLAPPALIGIVVDVIVKHTIL